MKVAESDGPYAAPSEEKYWRVMDPKTTIGPLSKVAESDGP